MGIRRYGAFSVTPSDFEKLKAKGVGTTYPVNEQEAVSYLEELERYMYRNAAERVKFLLKTVNAFEASRQAPKVDEKKVEPESK
jgi:hypothetical protein